MRHRERRSSQVIATRQHFFGKPCGWRNYKVDGWARHEVIVDSPSGGTLQGGSFPNKPVDHLKIDFQPARPADMKSQRVYDAHCGWYEYHRFSTPMIGPLPLTLTYLSSLTTGVPPNPSGQDLKDRLENPFGNNFAETVASITDAKGLLDQVGNFGKALKYIPRAVRRSKNNSKIMWKYLRSAPRAAGSAYLSNEFAWKQTGEDVARILAFFKPMFEQMDKLDRQEGIPQRMAWKHSYSTETVLPNGTVVTCHFVTRRTYTFVYHYTGARLFGGRPNYDYMSRLTRQAVQFWGLNTTSPKLMWELAPASWLVDQLLPIGDIIGDISTVTGPADWLQSGLHVTYLGGTTSSKCDFTIDYTYDFWRDNQGAQGDYWDIPEPTKFKAKGTHYVRTVTKDPPPGISVNRRGKTSISNTGKVYLGLVAGKKVGI